MAIANCTAGYNYLAFDIIVLCSQSVTTTFNLTFHVARDLAFGSPFAWSCCQRFSARRRIHKDAMNSYGDTDAKSSGSRGKNFKRPW